MDVKETVNVWHNPIHFLAFGLGAGTVKFAPGTVGTLVGVIFYLACLQLPLIIYAFITLIAFGVGIWLCDKTSKDLGVEDHPGIVWDEMVGFFITMFAVPQGWAWILAGFVLFRVLDILKPPPINLIEKKLTGGLAIMADDAAAGIIACLILNGAALLIYYS